MNIRVRAFARIRELLNFDTKTLQAPSDATVETVWRLISEPVPQLSRMRDALRFARNGRIVDYDSALQDGDELAVLPPSSGG